VCEWKCIIVFICGLNFLLGLNAPQVPVVWTGIKQLAWFPKVSRLVLPFGFRPNF
jgi:hypothetical protein